MKAVGCLLIAAVMLFTSACDKTKLGRVLSATERIERACPRIDGLLKQFAANGTLDPARAEEFGATLFRVRAIAGEINAQARQWTDLTDDTKRQVVTLFRSIADGLQNLNQAGVFIKDASAQNRFAAALTVALLALDEIESALGESVRSPPENPQGSPEDPGL